MRDRLDEMGDAEVVLVTFTRARNLRGYRSRLGLPFPVLADEGRDVYRAYGLKRGAWWRVYGPGPLGRYVARLLRGAKVERPTEDTLQLGGDFVVGRDGRLVLAHRSAIPDDRVVVDALVEAVAKA